MDDDSVSVALMLVVPQNWPEVKKQLIGAKNATDIPAAAQALNAQSRAGLQNALKECGLDLSDPQTARAFAWGAVACVDSMILTAQRLGTKDGVAASTALRAFGDLVQIDTL